MAKMELVGVNVADLNDLARLEKIEVETKVMRKSKKRFYFAVKRVFDIFCCLIGLFSMFSIDFFG